MTQPLRNRRPDPRARTLRPDERDVLRDAEMRQPVARLVIGDEADDDGDGMPRPSWTAEEYAAAVAAACAKGGRR